MYSPARIYRFLSSQTLVSFEDRNEDMTISKKSLEYKDATGKIYEGFVFYPADLESSKSKHPAVLVLHAFHGCTEFEQEQAENLAKEECFAMIRPLTEGDRSELAARLSAARDALAGLAFVDETKLGAMGYCFGGLCALEMARRNAPGLRAAVSFHGTLKPIAGMALGPMEASVQVHNGQADPHIGKDQITGLYDEMNERKADWQYIEHGLALHAFTLPLADKMGRAGVGYQKKAAERSWKMMIGLMEERLA